MDWNATEDVMDIEEEEVFPPLYMKTWLRLIDALDMAVVAHGPKHCITYRAEPMRRSYQLYYLCEIKSRSCSDLRRRNSV